METINRETERSFIMRNLPDLEYNKTILINQYYVPVTIDNNIVQARVRFYSDLYEFDTYVEILYKIHIDNGTCDEHHISNIHELLSIPEELSTTSEEFQNTIKELSVKHISKTRNIYETDNHKFEIDVFNDITLIRMEIELKDINEDIEFPDLIKKEIIAEITNIDGFSNSKIAYQ